MGGRLGGRDEEGGREGGGGEKGGRRWWRGERRAKRKSFARPLLSKRIFLSLSLALYMHQRGRERDHGGLLLLQREFQPKLSLPSLRFKTTSKSSTSPSSFPPPSFPLSAHPSTPELTFFSYIFTASDQIPRVPRLRRTSGTLWRGQ